jgi:Spy/CpxP family protein refolding chaperone
MKFARSWILLLTLLLAGAAGAQPPPPLSEGGPMRKQIRDKIKTMKIWKLTEEVGLTPEQSEKFFPVYNRHQKAIEELDARREELVNRLERLANGSEASDKEITGTAAELESIPGKIFEERKKFMKEIVPILPLRQRAKLMVFEERFKQRLQEFIRDIRREGHRPGMGD